MWPPCGPSRSARSRRRGELTFYRRLGPRGSFQPTLTSNASERADHDDSEVLAYVTTTDHPSIVLETFWSGAPGRRADLDPRWRQFRSSWREENAPPRQCQLGRVRERVATAPTGPDEAPPTTQLSTSPVAAGGAYTTVAAHDAKYRQHRALATQASAPSIDRSPPKRDSSAESRQPVACMITRGAQHAQRIGPARTPIQGRPTWSCGAGHV